MLESILEHYPQALGLPVRRIASGLINDSYRVGDAFVLQRLHRIFQPQVNLDIAALTPILRQGGVPVPEVVSTREGALWVEQREGASTDGTWRMLTLLPGSTLHRVETLEQAKALGTMLARFHGALRGVEHRFAFSRPSVHDTPRHMRALAEALHLHTKHRLWRQVVPLAEGIFRAWDAWGAIPVLPRRIGHGDPKISNFLFGGPGEITGVIDLDTMAWASLDEELGDALRSWCNAATEDEPSPRFDLGRYHAALEGYRAEAGSWLTPEEIASFPAATERICLELAARFAADALNENYFGWDPAAAPTRGEHNLLRGRGQFELAQDARRQLQPEAPKIS